MNRANALARALDEAGRTLTAIAPPSDAAPLRVEDGYDVQAQCAAIRAARGDDPTGYKLAARDPPDVLYGRLFQSMQLAEGGYVELKRCLRPRVVATIAYVLKRPLSATANSAEAADALEAVAPALAITDSRYSRADVTAADFVADNACASAFILGRCCKADLDVANLGILLDVNGRNVRVASTAALSGNPLRALLALARILAKTPRGLAQGDIVLAGDATPAHAFVAGDYIRSTTQNLGSVTIHVR